MELIPKQTIALDFLEDEVTTELEYGGAAGGGKSQLGAYFQLKRRMKYPGTRGMIGRSSLKTLKETSLKTFFEVAKVQGIKRGLHFDLTSSQDKENPNALVFSNGSLIYLKDLFLYPSDPEFDEFGSLEITDAWIDEAAQITQKAKDVVTSRMRYKLTENNLVPKLLVTTNPFKGWGYTDFYRPHKLGQLEPYRQFVAALPKDNPYLPQSYLDQLLRLPKAQRERLYYGNWEYDDDPAALIGYENILDLWRPRVVVSATDRRFITCDVARFGGDKTIIAVWYDWTIVEWVEIGKSSITQVAARIEGLMAKHAITKRQVAVDEDGVGGGVVDIVGCYGIVNGSRPMEERVPMQGKTSPNYANLKSQLNFRMADRINRQIIHITPGLMTVEQRERVIQSLEQVKQKDIDKDGKMAIVPKEQIKQQIGRSPDESDVIAFREYFELKPKSSFTYA